MELLTLIDGVPAAEIRVGTTRLDLDEGDLSPIAGDDIHFSQLGFIILFQNFKAVFFQIFRGELFTQRAEFFVGICHTYTFGSPCFS